MNSDDLYEKIAIKLGVDSKDVKEAHQSYWRFIKKKIGDVDLSDGVTEEELKELDTNFFVKRIGWFYINYNSYLRKYKENEDNKRKTAAESCSDNS